MTASVPGGPVGATVSEDLDRAAVAWTLSLLPTLVGAVGAGAVVPGAVLAGITDGRHGWAATAVAVTLVASTVITGSSLGLNLALAIVTVGGLVADGGPSTTELVALMLTLLVVHEVIRFSLDARQPSRFGPSLAAHVGWRSLAVGALLVGIGAGSGPLIDRAPTNELWIPVGVAVAAVPLFVLSAAQRLDGHARLDRPLFRAIIGAVVTVAVVVVVVIGAQARSDISSPAADQTPAPSVTTTTPTTEPSAAGQSDSTRTLPPWMVLAAVGLIAAFIYLMLRRPDAVLQLDDAEPPGEDSSFFLGVAGLADTEAELADIDEEAMARLLAELQLDISAEQDPARAIRFGYAKIEQRLARHGLQRADSETEREFLVRAMPPLGSAAAQMTALTELFERARFGHDPVDEAMRQRALDLIDALVVAITSLDVHQRTGGSEHR